MSFNKEFLKWKTANDVHGNMAFTRFVLFKFAEGLAESSKNKYVFKGGNLLWVYIKTPRPTIDLDLTSEENLKTEEIMEDISRINIPFMKFKVRSCDEKIKADSRGLGIVIEYEIENGSSSTFPIDIVLGVSSDTKEMILLLKYLKVATMENIIVDKVAACHSFKGGNTRMKDYDDLYRLAIESNLDIKEKALFLLASKRAVSLHLESRWINDSMLESWDNYLSNKAYKKGSKDLPRDLYEVFDIINDFLNNVKKIAQLK